MVNLTIIVNCSFSYSKVVSGLFRDDRALKKTRHLPLFVWS